MISRGSSGYSLQISATVPSVIASLGTFESLISVSNFFEGSNTCKQCCQIRATSPKSLTTTRTNYKLHVRNLSSDKFKPHPMCRLVPLSFVIWREVALKGVTLFSLLSSDRIIWCRARFCHQKIESPTSLCSPQPAEYTIQYLVGKQPSTVCSTLKPVRVIKASCNNSERRPGARCKR